MKSLGDYLFSLSFSLTRGCKVNTTVHQPNSMKLQTHIGDTRIVATDEKKGVAYIERKGRRLMVPVNPPVGSGVIVVDGKPYSTHGAVIGNAELQ